MNRLGYVRPYMHMMYMMYMMYTMYRQWTVVQRGSGRTYPLSSAPCYWQE